MEKEIINDKFEILRTYHVLNNRNVNILHLEIKCIDCGSIYNGRKGDLSLKTKCVGCRKLYLDSFIGKRFGKLVVLNADKKKYQGHTMMNCICDCGNEFKAVLSKLNRGVTESCGCLHPKGNNRVHNMSNTRIYKLYYGMKDRCHNSNQPNYENYGKRGIFVCQEWLDDFMNFYNWAMENGYTDELSIDRIDNDGPYAPWNCRWITMKEQQVNKSNTLLFEHEGCTYNLLQIMEMYNLSYDAVRYRYMRNELGPFLKSLYYTQGNKICNDMHNAIHNDNYYNRKCGIDK